jgi:hypothetical protein
VVMGWARWLELRLLLPPAADRAAGWGGVQRAAGWVSAASMLLIGAILLFYREG